MINTELSSATKANDPNVIKNEIYTTNVTISRISGVEGTNELGSYRDRINTDPEKETVGQIPSTTQFSAGKLSYTNCIKEFRQFFHKETDNDPLRTFSKILKLRKPERGRLDVLHFQN